jgi:PIN domain nuclease of toxin-antitoxin system
LPPKIRNQINDPNNIVLVSAASLWEFAIKMNLKKIDTKINLPQIQAHIIEHEYGILGISFKHLNALSNLPHLHGDPFDRLLIAQAITEDLTIVSADKQFRVYPVNVIW